MCSLMGVSKSVPLGWLVHSIAIWEKSKFPRNKGQETWNNYFIICFQNRGDMIYVGYKLMS
jgi:hypothetical protein